MPSDERKRITAFGGSRGGAGSPEYEEALAVLKARALNRPARAFL